MQQANDQLTSALRQLLIATGAYMAGRGWIDEGIAAALVPVLLIAGPMLWSQLKIRKRHKVAE